MKHVAQPIHLVANQAMPIQQVHPLRGAAE